MRVAFVGKGGSGKSTIVGVTARLLGRDGRRVVVLDSDVMPGLAGALGLDASDAPIPDEATIEGPEEDGPRYILRPGLDAEAAVEAYARRAPDDVRLLQIGKLHREGAWTIARSQLAFRQIARELPGEGWDVIGDLPGGTRQPFFGWGAFADTLVVVLEPTVKSFMTGRRLRRLADVPEAPRLVALANKVRAAGDADRIAQETGLRVVGQIPEDRAIRDADRAGVALVDHAPDSAAVAAVGSFITYLQEVPT